MLKAGCANCKFKCGLRIGLGCKAVDKTACERVAAANAVNDIGDIISTAVIKLLAVVDAGRPKIAVCRLGFTQGNCNSLHVGVLCKYLFGDLLVAIEINLAKLGLVVRGNSESLLAIFLVCNNNIDILCKLGHNLVCTLAVLPKLRAVVEVNRGSHAHFLSDLKSADCFISDALRNCGGDTGYMEPFCIGKNSFPVKITLFNISKRRISAVVDNL